MNILLFIVAAILLLVVMVKLDSWRRNKKVEAAFKDRESLTTEQLYEQYFEVRGIPFQVVAGVKAVLEEQLGLDLSRITDSDNFSTNLNFISEFDSMALVEAVYALEERFGIKISDSEAENASTIRDIVELVNSKVST